jgi:hypothetical protein
LRSSRRRPPRRTRRSSLQRPQGLRHHLKKGHQRHDGESRR